MMRCSCAQCRFSAYIDRELDEDDEAELLEHLAQCSECSDELARLKETLGTLRALPEVDPGPDFYAGIQTMIHSAGERFASTGGRRWSWARWLPATPQLWLRPALGAALGLAAGIIVTASSPNLVAFVAGTPGTHPTAQQIDYRETADAIAQARSASSSESPLAGITLPPMRSATDSLNVASEPEYVLEPYVADPNRGLVPVGYSQGRVVGGDADSQSDVFVTF
jgi:anti-sigma factor RsiW